MLGCIVTRIALECKEKVTAAPCRAALLLLLLLLLR